MKSSCKLFKFGPIANDQAYKKKENNIYKLAECKKK